MWFIHDQTIEYVREGYVYARMGVKELRSSNETVIEYYLMTENKRVYISFIKDPQYLPRRDKTHAAELSYLSNFFFL